MWRRRVPSTLALLVLWARAFGVRVPGGRRIATHRIELARVTGRLWAPSRPAPGLLFVAGVTPEGVEDPRVRRAAHALAQAGRVVFAPDLELAHHRLEQEDVARLGRAAVALDAHPHVRGRVAGLGFSFGGSFLLLAAADPEVAARLRVVATFGAYADLAGLVQAVATGTSVVDGRRIPWRLPPGRLESMRATLRERLAAELPDLADSLQHDDPAETEARLARLPAEVRRLLHDLSPARHADRIRVPIAALHALDDPVVPSAELERLAHAFPNARTYRVRLFTHVDPRLSPRDAAQTVRDLRTALAFSRDVLGA